jgi:periplasmic copper chaperone A
LSLSHAVRRLPAVLVAALVALAGLLVVGVGTASAHVSVSSDDASPGGFGTLTFQVPNESAAASTVGVRIQLPTDTPLTSVRAQPVAGWTIALTTVALDPPVQSEDGDTIDSAVSVVEYRADAGGGIAPGQFQQFALAGGPFPDTDELAFNVVQTYSDGSEAAWIEPTVQGQPEPEHPAPVLSLSGTPTDPGTATAASSTTADDGSDTRATIALVLGGLGLLAGLAGLYLGLTARRRTVSS